ncbi:MAG TPA: hypothetical protein VN310_02830 [Candidatus Dormibacteraeota bacterium]|nr:hypothetical protein [Candidatus Dormibacteraeota bacterium]
MQDEFCSVTRSATSSTEAVKAAGSAGIPLPIADDIVQLKAGANYETSSSSWSEWYQQFCDKHLREQVLDTQYTNVTHEFSKYALEAAKACYASNTAGLHGQITPTGDKRMISISVRYHPNGSEKATLRGPVRATDPDSISSCNPGNKNNLFDDGWFSKVDLNSGAVAQCIWNPEKNFGTVINTTSSGSLALSLDADPPPVPAKSGDVVQRGYSKLTFKDPCFDSQNYDNQYCPLWNFDFQPVEKQSTVTVTVTVDADFTLSPPGPGGYARGCTGDAATSDRWRAGTIYLRGCGKEVDGGPWSMETEGAGFKPEFPHSFTAVASCQPNGSPLQLSLVGHPRGCSEMKINNGLVTFHEIKQ